MKKFFVMAIAALAFASCADDSQTIINGGGTGESPKTEPSTKVYIQGKEQQKSSRAAALVAQGTDAYYFIRIGSDIPGLDQLGSSPSKEYWPQSSTGTTLFAEGNKGALDLDYPYWNQGNAPIGKYVFDTTGKAVEKAITTIPELANILSANKNTKYNTTLANMAQEKDIKIIWYVAKFNKDDGTWHVDGVLTHTSTKDATDVVPGLKDEEGNKDFENKADEVKTIGGNVEVDIHQQQHTDWNEIKTSIHVRDIVDGVEVFIPIPKANVAEADDFAIRTYDYELQSKVYINGTEYALNNASPIKVTIEHKDNGVYIKVNAINSDYIKALQKEYGDGVTIEVHTYYKGLTHAAAWALIKQSKVTVEPVSYDKLKTSITSAFYKN